MTKSYFYIVILICYVCLFFGRLSAFAADTYYSYEDAGGGVHFSDEPPSVPSFTAHRFTQEETFRNAVQRLSKPELRRLIGLFAERYEVEPALIEAVVKAESEYDPKAVSRSGARGLMQLMPETAKTFGVRDLHDPEENLRAGILHLKKLLQKFQGDIGLAAAAYNAGEGAVTRYKGVPPYPETVDYVQKVRKYYDRFRENASRSARYDAQLIHSSFVH